MSKMKDLLLKFVGYQVAGIASLDLWGGGEGTIEMNPRFIDKDKLSASTLKSCINDGGFGCQKITAAELVIYKVYGEYPYYKQYDRTINLNQQQCLDGLRGINVH